MTISRRDFLLHSGVLTGATLLAGRRAWSAEDTADVIVIGAGLSGLQAAWTLEQKGFKVLVLEGRTAWVAVSSRSATSRASRKRAATSSTAITGD